MDQAADTVSLSYTMTADDIRHAMRVRARVAASWLTRAMLPIGIVLVSIALVLSITLAFTDGLSTRSWTWIIVYAVVLTTAMVLLPLLRKRQYQQLADRMGTIRVSVDDAGVRLSTDHSSSENAWSAYGSFVETDQAYVLLSPDKKRLVFTTLPKRGLGEPSDAERLREILSRHLP